MKNKEPKEYFAKEKIIECSHCSNRLFLKSQAQLNTAGLTFMGLDWLNKTANILICKECGQILWFLDSGKI